MRLPAFALLLLASPVVAQTVVRPGDAALTGAHVSAGERQYTVRLISPMQQDVGTLTERTTVDADRITRVTSISVPMARQSQTDSTIAAWPSLAPIAHHSTSSARTRTLAFTPTGVSGTETRADSAATISVAFDAPVFDSAWASEIIQSLPLASGYTATLPAYDDGDGPSDIAVEVTGREDVTTAAGVVPAYIVAVTNSGRTTTYALAEATHEILRFQFSPQAGVVIEITPN